MPDPWSTHRGERGGAGAGGRFRPHAVATWAGVTVWGGVAVLTAIALAGAAARGFLPDFLVTYGEPGRAWILERLGRSDPFASERAAEALRFEAPYRAHPIATLLHIGPGSVFLLLALLQLSPRIRSRHLRLHRWSGRIAVAAGAISAAAGLYFGLATPYGGRGETVVVVLVAAFFFVAAGRGVTAARRKRVAEHREWMIRAYAVMIAIASVRVVAAAYEVLLTPLGLRPDHLFVLSLWTGWALTLGAAETWIRWTRPRPCAQDLAYCRALGATSVLPTPSGRPAVPGLPVPSGSPE